VGSSTDAQAAYETAVKQSVAFYYYLNSLNTTGGAVLAPPTLEEVNTFVDASTIAYTGGTTAKLALIWTQKWLHLGFLQSTQAWAEYRRTNYPQLTFPSATLSGMKDRHSDWSILPMRSLITPKITRRYSLPILVTPEYSGCELGLPSITQKGL
jgi:hypothetical protein